jgi:hypothetical protein
MTFLAHGKKWDGVYNPRSKTFHSTDACPALTQIYHYTLDFLPVGWRKTWRQIYRYKGRNCKRCGGVRLW